MRLIMRFNLQTPALNEHCRPIAASYSAPQLLSLKSTAPSTPLSSLAAPEQKAEVCFHAQRS